MPWKQTIQEQVSGMNISNGGKAIRFQPVKVAKANKPLLVIGLGGTGLRIGRRIKDMFIERFIPATVPTPGLDERLPSFTRFLAVDTDRDDMNTLGYQGSERCEIGDPNIASKLAPENRKALPSYISDWLNPNIVSNSGNGVEKAEDVTANGARLKIIFRPSAKKNIDGTVSTRALSNGYNFVRMDGVATAPGAEGEPTDPDTGGDSGNGDDVLDPLG